MKVMVDLQVCLENDETVVESTVVAGKAFHSETTHGKKEFLNPLILHEKRFCHDKTSQWLADRMCIILSIPS